jgi:hypothetical protein
MKNHLKLILVLGGAVFVLLGGYLSWTALYPGMGEFQELSVADYVSGKTIDVSVHYPLRVLIGKTGQVRVKYASPMNLIPGSALDQELNLPGFVVTPQKRIMTTLIDGQKGTAAWKIVPVAPEETQAVVSLALESVPNGMFALSPTAQLPFQIKAYDVLGMEYATILKLGLIFLAVGAFVLFLGIKLQNTQPKLSKKPRIYG